MKNYKYIIMTFSFLMFGLLSCKASEKPAGARSKTSFYDLSMVSLEGEPVDFREFKGKKVLIVNVASKCGFTPQYAGLQEMHEKYGDKLQIIGFPANNFMRQEPGTNEDIAEFCERNYGVDFLMSEKVSVKGRDMHTVYQWLTQRNQNGWNRKSPSWNFFKYLIDEQGELIAVFNSRTEPTSEKIVKLIVNK
jgi:glutathione peroxidase